MSASCAPLGGGRVLVDGHACGERFAAVLEYRPGRGVVEAEWDPSWVRVLLERPPPPFQSSCQGGAPEVSGVRVLSGGLRGFGVVLEAGGGLLQARVSRRVELDNIEFLVLSYLTRAGCRVAPRLHCHVLYEGAQYMVVEDHVEGEPVAAAAVRDAASRPQGPPSPRVRGLLEATAAAAEALHEALCSCREAWCEPEPVTEHDVGVWVERVRWRARAIEAAAGEAGVEVDPEYLDALEELASEMDHLGEALLASVKMRIHGDLHLYQAIDAGGRVVITDYEGEPYKDPASRLEKETPERDLAALLRSLDYAAALARGSWPGHEETHAPWLRAAAAAVAEAYLSRASRADCPGLDPTLAPQAAAFWLMERASYEAYYELRARTGLHDIPLAAIARMAGGRDPLLGMLLKEQAP